MKKFILNILLAISSIRLLPHLAAWMLSTNRDIICADLKRWVYILFDISDCDKMKQALYFLRIMTFYPEYRNLFYYRTGTMGKLLIPLCPRLSTLYITAKKIGPGLFIQHGFSTILSTDAIGSNCWINQQVTLGYTNKKDCPTLGDNVHIGAGAIVIGAVHIGNNCRIGANAIVNKNVPPDCTVVGMSAYIVKQNGIRVNRKL